MIIKESSWHYKLFDFIWSTFHKTETPTDTNLCQYMKHVIFGILPAVLVAIILIALFIVVGIFRLLLLTILLGLGRPDPDYGFFERYIEEFKPYRRQGIGLWIPITIVILVLWVPWSILGHGLLTFFGNMWTLLVIASMLVLGLTILTIKRTRRWLAQTEFWQLFRTWRKATKGKFCPLIHIEGQTKKEVPDDSSSPA